MIKEFKKGDPIAWITQFGYDLGYWLEPGGDTMYNADWILLKTGKIKGRTLRSKDEIKLLTWDLMDELRDRFGYDLSQ